MACRAMCACQPSFLLRAYGSISFNVVSPDRAFTIGDVIKESIAAANLLAKPAAPPRPTWIPVSFLAQQGVRPHVDMPLWFPDSDERGGFHHMRVERAIEAGLKISSLRKTVHDTLSWHLARPEEERANISVGMAPQRELEVLAAWRAMSQS
jgi:2'-hydroxyisoflavone reductase